MYERIRQTDEVKMKAVTGRWTEWMKKERSKERKLHKEIKKRNNNWKSKIKQN